MNNRKIIDVQSHFLPEKWLKTISDRTEYPYLEKKNEEIWVVHGSSYDRLPYYTTKSGININSKLREMDAAGIELSLLSLSPAGPDNGFHTGDADELARFANDGIAEVVACYPHRFRGIANLGYGNVTDSVNELKRCIDKLGFVGLQVYPYVGGKTSVVHPDFKPIWQVLAERKVPLIFHPGSPLNSDYGNYLIGGLMGYWFDDAIIMVKFILSGLLDEFPDLKIVCPHTWSLLPYLIDRLDFQVSRFAKHFPDMKNKKLPSEYLKNVYTDCNNFSSDDLVYALKKMKGIDFMMYGSDSPFMPADFVVNLVERTGLSVTDMEKIFSGNARRLFGLNL